MFLQPVEKPSGLMGHLSWAWSRWKFGKVMTPLRVVYARSPGALPISRAISTYLERGHRLDPGLVFLLTQFVGLENHCTFCLDIGQAIARPGGKLKAKLAALDRFETDESFSEREKVALRFAKEWLDTRYAGGPARDALKFHFNDREIVEIVLVCACENYYNSINHALGIGSDGLCAVPGR